MAEVLGTAIAVAAFFICSLWLFQRRLIYLPIRAVPPVDEVLPGAEEVSFETADGLRLNGWFLPAAGSPADADPAGPLRPAVLVFNGNGGNRAMRTPLARALADAGWSVLLFDYRGYGGNPGSPTETGLTVDARAARGYLAGRPGVDPNRIVYFGESLGAAVAVALAVEVPPAGLILRSPFTSLADVAAIHYPVLPVRLLLADRYPSIERIGRVGAPVLFLAGDRDGIVPPAQTRRLYEAAGEPREMVLIPGADHNDFDLLAGGRMMEAVLAFLSATEPRARRFGFGTGGGIFS